MMNEKLKDEYTNRLFAGILSLKTTAECYQFFSDLCTVSEIKSMAQRLQVADMLRDGKTYIEITEKTGVSTATISRVNRCLEYGSDGYKIVLRRLEDEQKKKDE
jgi:TrpR-related protein YerC/YecD